jgi:hypothetical protein
MTGTAIRRFAALAALLALPACAGVSQPLPPLAMADLGEQPAPTPPPHHSRLNPFFHHAAYVAPAPKALSSRSPIVELCANPQAKAVLDQDLPGLTTRPEFDFFKHMSLQTLKSMSRGKMTDEDVAKVDADLAKLDTAPRQTASIAP